MRSTTWTALMLALKERGALSMSVCVGVWRVMRCWFCTDCSTAVVTWRWIVLGLRTTTAMYMLAALPLTNQSLTLSASRVERKLVPDTAQDHSGFLTSSPRLPLTHCTVGQELPSVLKHAA